jgi:hypothetical protein
MFGFEGRSHYGGIVSIALAAMRGEVEKVTGLTPGITHHVKQPRPYPPLSRESVSHDKIRKLWPRAKGFGRPTDHDSGKEAQVYGAEIVTIPES